MAAVVWKLPERHAALPLAVRVAAYPALYLREAGVEVRLSRTPARVELERASGFVVCADGALGVEELTVLDAAARRGVPALVQALRGLPAGDLRRLMETGAVLVAPEDDGPLASRPAAPKGLRVAPVVACAARPAEDEMLAAELQRWAGPASEPASEYLIAVVEDDAALRELAPALRNHAARSELDVLLVADAPDSLSLEAVGLAGAHVIDTRSPELLGLLRRAAMLLCAFPTAHPSSAEPGTWVRTALMHGVPAVAASHPSIDGLAHLCVLDDWERGLQLYESSPIERLKAGARAQLHLAERVRPSKVAHQWRQLLADAGELRRSPDAGRRRPEPRPVVLALFDLSQDADVLLPVIAALRDRGGVRVRVAATDWLETESPRTLQSLRRMGFEVELLPRGEVRAGRMPELNGVDAVVSASDTSAGPHRSAHSLASRAGEARLPSFTLQHGFENIGLTYRDDVHGEEVTFASDKVFSWGPPASFPPWLTDDTRRRIVPVGSPKRTPPPSAALRVSDRAWRRAVGVFENLHWHRYDEAYRNQFLADLTHIAEEQTDVLFVVKPHHAGRWLVKNPQVLRVTDNLKLLDPADPAWQPYTAPVLIASLDAIVTTPSTVAMDAARGGRPVAVAGYDLELGLYSPLPLLRSLQDWRHFLATASGHLERNEEFLRRTLLPGQAAHRIAGAIEGALLKTPELAGA